MKHIIWLLLLVFVWLSGCYAERLPVDIPADLQPSAVIEQITPLESYAGEPVSFRGYGTDVDGSVVAYEWYSDLDGQLSTSAEYETASLSEGIHAISFQVQDDAGQWSDQVYFTLEVLRRPPPPKIEYFRASSARISQGDGAMLSWYITGANTVYINEGAGNVPWQGSIEVSPPVSTTYTLTAANEGGSSVADVDILVIPARTGLPVINSFESTPGSIIVNDAADLTWHVSNADLVLIDPGIGTVESAGSATISPEVTTIYTLTAYNGVGITTASTQVLVSESAVVGIADLSITGVARVESKDGLVIEYTVTNLGENDSPASTTMLYANGIFQALEAVGPLPAGSSITQRIAGWLYDPSTSVIEVTADAGHVVAESDESNNSKTVFFPVRTVFDFVKNASGAQWGSAYPYSPLLFGEPVDADNGVAAYQKNAIIEDASGPGTFLETRPRATFGGWIIGDYSPGIDIEPGCYFYGLVGLMKGAVAGDVMFHVYIRESTGTEWTELSAGVYDWYDYKVKSLVIPVPAHYFGKEADFSLRVSTNGEPLQDRAVWIEAKLIR